MKKAKYITANRRQRGFTIIELMITITIVGVLLSIAAPAMQTFVMNNRLNSAAQEYLRTLQTARSEATKRQRDVTVCAAIDPSSTTCATSNITGWIMFDSNGLIETHTIDDTKMHLLVDSAVVYTATGFADPASGSAVVMCDSRGNVDANGETTQTNSVARGIDIVGTGRARVTKTLSEITGLLGTVGSTCPP